MVIHPVLQVLKVVFVAIPSSYLLHLLSYRLSCFYYYFEICIAVMNIKQHKKNLLQMLRREGSPGSTCPVPVTSQLLFRQGCKLSEKAIVFVFVLIILYGLIALIMCFSGSIFSLPQNRFYLTKSYVAFIHKL